MLPTGLTPMLVYRAGNVETMFDPRITTARPRYSVSVPIVTASDGSPKRVISKPLKSPGADADDEDDGERRPHRPAVEHQVAERRAADIPRIEATERSISPVMTIRVSGSVMIASSPIEMQR